MSSTNQTLAQALLLFGNNYCQTHLNVAGKAPSIEYDKDWPSPCELEACNENEKYWRPYALPGNGEIELDEEKLNFTNIESALGITLHADIKTYFTTMFSFELDAECEDGLLTLLFAWNAEDFLRLQENIIGHILMKQKLKQEETVFFAVTDEEDIIISVLNETGEVWAERVGCKPHKKLSNSLCDFIEQLSPKVEK